MPSEITRLEFSELTEQAREEFAVSREFISGVLDSFFDGVQLTHTSRDIPTLQALVDLFAMKNANDSAWVALGITFGDALVDYIRGLAWCMVSTDDDTYAALQFKRKAVSISAPTMLWKRVENGDEIDLMHIASELKLMIESGGDEYGDA